MSSSLIGSTSQKALTAKASGAIPAVSKNE
jgi:hypothetical protein